MLDVAINDKLIKITDDNFTKAKINSIKIIVDKYGIKDILDFKLTITQEFHKIMQSSAGAYLTESISITELYDILSEIFENFEKEIFDDDDDVTISFEALFIL